MEIEYSSLLISWFFGFSLAMEGGVFEAGCLNVLEDVIGAYNRGDCDREDAVLRVADEVRFDVREFFWWTVGVLWR